MFIDIVPVTRVTVEFPTDNSAVFHDRLDVDFFIEICRAHHGIFEDYPDRLVGCCRSLRDSTKHLSKNWGTDAQGETMERLGLLEAKRIVEEGIDW